MIYLFDSTIVFFSRCTALFVFDVLHSETSCISKYSLCNTCNVSYTAHGCMLVISSLIVTNLPFAIYYLILCNSLRVNLFRTSNGVCCHVFKNRIKMTPKHNYSVTSFLHPTKAVEKKRQISDLKNSHFSSIFLSCYFI